MNEDHPDWLRQHLEGGKPPPLPPLPPDPQDEDRPPRLVRFFIGPGVLWLLSALFMVIGQINYLTANGDMAKVIWAASYHAVGLIGFLMVCVLTALRNRPQISFTAIVRPPHE